MASLPLALGFNVLGLDFRGLMTKTRVKSKDAYEVADIIVEQAISSIRTI